MTTKELNVGNIVELKITCLGNPIGARGYVFAKYGHGGAQIIFPNGEYDGFSVEEQGEYLKKVGHSTPHENYKFENVTKVSADHREGYWFGNNIDQLKEQFIKKHGQHAPAFVSDLVDFIEAVEREFAGKVGICYYKYNQEILLDGVEGRYYYFKEMSVADYEVLIGTHKEHDSQGYDDFWVNIKRVSPKMTKEKNNNER